MMTDYILSPCSLAARGLSQLMLNAAKRPVELPVEGVSLRELAAVKRIVVYLPDDPLWMLTTLRQAAGNFYVNDKPTGAVVGQQPFGGARASGTNDKAGSLWNLMRWVSPRSVKEALLSPTTIGYPHMAAEW